MSEGRDLKKSVALLDIIIQLIQLDKDQYISSKKLAENLGVSRRTVFRYINDLIYLQGISVEVNRGKGYRISLGKGLLEKLRVLTKNLYEAVMLASVASPIYSKLGSKIPYSIKRELDVIENVISNQDLVSADAEKVSILLDSAKNGRKVIAKYISLSDLMVRERVIQPYGLFIRSGQLYCVGFCEKRQEIRTFRVDRFLSVSPTNERFEVPENFSIKRYLENTIFPFTGGGKPITVKAWISEKLKTYLEHSPLVKSQRIYSECGNYFIELKVASVKDFVIWAFSWMDDIRVIEPPDVVERIRSTCQRVLSMYSGGFLDSMKDRVA